MIATDLRGCLEQSTARLKEATRRAEIESWSKEQICLNSKEEINSVELCFNEVAKRKHTPNAMISLAEKAAFIIYPSKPETSLLEDWRKRHNEVCAEFPTTLVR